MLRRKEKRTLGFSFRIGGLREADYRYYRRLFLIDKVEKSKGAYNYYNLD